MFYLNSSNAGIALRKFRRLTTIHKEKSRTAALRYLTVAVAGIVLYQKVGGTCQEFVL